MTKGTIHIPAFVLDTTKARIKEIEADVQNLLKEKDSLLAFIKQVNGIDTVIHEVKQLETVIDSNGYNAGWTWNKKIQFILKERGASTTTEIVDKIVFEYEPNLKPNRNSVVASISAILSTRSKADSKALYTRTKNDRDESVFDLINK